MAVYSSLSNNAYNILLSNDILYSIIYSYGLFYVMNFIKFAFKAFHNLVRNY